MQDFHQLKVWEKAHVLTLDVYRMTGRFPNSEVFGLRSQLRRASASIAANIAEGCGRSSRAEFGQFLNQAIGSASELEYHLLLARDLQLIDVSAHDLAAEKTIEVKRMLASLHGRVRPSRRGA